MNRFQVFIAVGFLLVPVGTSEAFDTVKTTSGTTLGKITAMSPFQVELRQGSTRGPKEIPVNQIVAIFFEGEPISLKSAKNFIAVEHRYRDGLAALERVKKDEIADRKELRQDVEYYTALANARLALGGSGKIADAGREILNFVRKHSGSYHYLQACEVLSDLLVANRSYAQAEEYYGKLASAPWPDYKMKAGVAIGRVQLAQGKTAKAMTSFNNVLAFDGGEGPSIQAQRHAALLGKAAVLAATNNPDEAIRLVENMLQKANPEDANLMALAYNTLGAAYRQSGRPKEALLAFLHTDLLFYTHREAHAEALYNLAELWEQVHKPERAARARQLLEEQYKNSPWAKKAH